MQSTEPQTIFLSGTDPLFRAWLIYGGSGRNATVIYMIREGGEEEWETDVRYVGRVGEVLGRREGGFSLQVDSEIYVPSQDGRATRMSDEAQRSVWPEDTVYAHLKALAGGRRDVFPG